MTHILKTAADIKAFRDSHTQQTIGFVPTMGNLHAGHLSLMEISQKHSDITIASIFVNPTQFGPNEDLEAYPRTFDEDLAKLQQHHVDAVFVPNENTMYPYGESDTISIHMPQSMTQILCGNDRPGHFQGVATVVAKLFQIVSPDVAVFGEKDFQQLAIIRRLNRELFMDINIHAAPINRETDGLAMSSRNQYLNSKERQLASWLSTILTQCRQQILAGSSVNKVIANAKQELTEKGILVEYLDFRGIENLAENPDISDGILLIAGRIGKTRLIDNLRIDKSSYQ